MAVSRRAYGKAVALFCLVGAPACSLFVSLDGLDDGAAIDAGSDSFVDAGDNDASETSAIDAHVTTPPVFRSLSTASNSVVNDAVTVSRAPQIQAGDLMIALVYEYQDSSSTTAPDATWLPLTSFHDPVPSYEVHYFQKFATASEPSSYTFQTPGTNNGYASVTLVAYSGVDATNPIALSAVATSENVTAFISPSFTTTVPNTLLMISAVGDGQTNASWTAPANITPRLSNGYVFAGDAVQTVAGVATTETIACAPSSGTTASGGIAVIALAPQQ